MSETSKRLTNETCYISGRGLLENVKGNKQPNVEDIPGIPMEIKVEGYEIVLDEKSGKVLRVKDNRTIGEVIDDRRRRKILDAMKKKENGLDR